MDLLFEINGLNMIGFEQLASLPWQDTKFCVIAIVGKSSNHSKSNFVNTIINSDSSMVASEKWTSGDNLCRLVGYCDEEKQVICLHLQSTYDSYVLADLCQKAESDITLNGCAGVLRMAEFSFAKALLFVFLMSHVVVVVHPGSSFDIGYVRLFRTMDSVRLKIQPVLTDILKRIARTSGISKDWVSAGRPCSPRVLFVFEGCRVNEDDDEISAGGRSHSQKVPAIKALQHSMEDQIYRILRKARIITNTSNNSLFAIPANQEFVFIKSWYPATIDLGCYYLEQLRISCTASRNKTESSRGRSYRQSRPGAASSSSASSSDKQSLKTDSSLSVPSSENLSSTLRLGSSNDRVHCDFAAFVMPHIDLALSRGFDDNIGRNPVAAIFELASLADWAVIAQQFHGIFWTAKDSRSQNSLTALKSLMDIDVRFSDSRCSKVLPLALAAYQEGLPSHYVRAAHLSRLQQAKRVFAMQARGPACDRYLVQLEQECDRIWRNGHQMCEEISLTGNYCIHELHRLIDLPDMSEEMVRLPLKQHMSQFKTRATCNCGRRQGEREDPFDHRSANYDFFERLEQTCCRELKHYGLSVFKPSTTDSRPAAVLKTISANPVTSDCGSERSPKALTSEHRDVLKFEGGASSLSLALSLSQNCDAFNERRKRFSLENKDRRSGSGEDEDNEMVAGADASIDDDSIVVGTCEVDSQAELMLAAAHRQHSTTEYLPGMVHSNSPPGLLPKFPSWSVVLLSDYSSYNSAQGVDQPGFTHGCNYLLPVDITLKIDSEKLSSYPEPAASSKKGIKHRKGQKELADVTLRLFVGFEYECSRGHRFFLSSPDRVFKVPPNGIFKETGHRVLNHDMPLYFQCTCSRSGKVLVAQLMRIHIGIPDGPVEAKIRPKVQPGPAPCPLFSPETDELVLKPGVWILRLPYVYLGESGPYLMPTTDPQSVLICRFFRNFLTVAELSSESAG